MIDGITLMDRLEASRHLGTVGALAIAGAISTLSGFSGCASREVIPASDPDKRPSFEARRVGEGAHAFRRAAHPAAVASTESPTAAASLAAAARSPRRARMPNLL